MEWSEIKETFQVSYSVKKQKDLQEQPLTVIQLQNNAVLHLILNNDQRINW